MLERLLPAPGEGGQAWSELNDFLTKRIKQGLGGDLAAKSFDQIVDEKLGKARPLDRTSRAAGPCR